MIRNIFVFICVFLLTANSGYGNEVSDEDDIGEQPVVTFRFQVQIRKKQSQLCSGLIVNEKTILTAANCVYKKDAEQLSVRTVNMSKDYWVSHIIIHPQFKLATMKNDLALVILKEPLTPPIEVANFDTQEAAEGQFVALSGWGYTSPSSITYSDYLMRVTVKTISNAKCQEMWAPEAVAIYPSQICTYTQSAVPKGACDGDSGGPVISNEGKIIGVISYTSKPCVSGFPDVHTRIQPYMKWIKENTVV